MRSMTRSLADEAPDVVAAVYGALMTGIDGAIELAGAAARRQGLITRDPEDIDALFAL